MRSRVLVAVLNATIMITCPACADNKSTHDARRTIAVSGEALVKVAPDKIVVTFGIETWDAEITAAKTKNNDILRTVIASIKELGIPQKEIQTDHLSLKPMYKDGYRSENILGYFVRNTFIVTLTEAAKVEELVTKALQAGVNHIHGVDFQTTDLKKYRNQAREQAVRAAKEKAEKMASVLGQSVGSPILIREGYAGSPWRYYSSWSGWGYGRGEGMSQNVIQSVQNGASEISDTIALGKLAIRANVNVTFELEK